MGTYIAVTLKQPRRYKFWLGRRCLDGSIALIAEFVNEHTLGVVVLKLNDQTIPEPAMDPEQPGKIDFHHPSVVTGEAFRSHPDSVRAHNQRWPNDKRDPETGRRVNGPVRKPGGPDQPAPDAPAVAHPAGAEPEARHPGVGGHPADD